jgi:hypothetical protein
MGFRFQDFYRNLTLIRHLSTRKNQHLHLYEVCVRSLSECVAKRTKTVCNQAELQRYKKAQPKSSESCSNLSFDVYINSSLRDKAEDSMINLDYA